MFQQVLSSSLIRFKKFVTVFQIVLILSEQKFIMSKIASAFTERS